jgi:hypothetical protein
MPSAANNLMLMLLSPLDLPDLKSLLPNLDR